VFALRVSIDLATSTASATPMSVDELAAATGFSVDSLLSLKAGYDAQLATPDHNVMLPQFIDADQQTAPS